MANRAVPHKLGKPAMTVADRTAVALNAGCKKRVLMTVQGGGFFWQSRSVAKDLVDEFELCYISSNMETAFPQSGLPPAPWHKVTHMTTLASQSTWHKIRDVTVALRDTYRVIRSVKPQAIVCVATSLAVPLCFWGKIFGIKTVFIDSITRVSTPSATGRILTRFRLCNRFYVQWPEAKSMYRGSVCKGTVL